MPRLTKFNKRKKSNGKDCSNKKIKNLTGVNHSNGMHCIFFLADANLFFILFLVDDLIYNSSSTSKEDDANILVSPMASLDDLGK